MIKSIIQNVQLLLLSFYFFLLGSTTFIAAEGVRRDTKIFTPAGIFEAHQLVPGLSVFCIDKQGRLTTSPITKVKKDEVMSLVEITVKGKNLKGEEKTATILADALQRTYCPNRRAWVKFCELDATRDFVCINFYQPTPIVAIRELPFYVWKMKASVYFFEVKEYGHFFVSDLLVPLHNTTFLVVPPLMVAAEFLKDIAISFGVAFAKAGATEFFNNVRDHGQSQKQEKQDQNVPSQNNQDSKDPKDPKNKDKAIAVAAAGAAKKTADGTNQTVSNNGLKNDLHQLNQNKINHITNGSKSTGHRWEKLVPDKNWDKIKSLIQETLETGFSDSYKKYPSKIKNIKGEIIEVVYREVDGIIEITNAWIR